MGNAGPRAGRGKVLTVPSNNSRPSRARQYYLRVSFTLAKSELWAKAGYEVAAVQFKLPLPDSAPSRPALRR